MTIKNIQVELTDKTASLSADMQFKSGNNNRIYFSVDRKYGKFIVKDASPFLAVVLFSCMKISENITIEGSVSEKLLKSTQKIMNLVESWNMGKKKVNIKVKQAVKDTINKKNVALFFSGGVDSSYTYLKNKKEGKNKITHLITVHGFDVKLENNSLFNEAITPIMNFAKTEKVEIIVVRTNIRQITDRYVEWEDQCGSAMGAVCLALRNGLKEVYMSAGVELTAMRPVGSHPDLDPLWSTETLRVIHDGIERNRLEKVRYLSDSEKMLISLRVCWRNKKGSYNCCECEKCFRTMIMLEAVGALKKSKSFNKPINLSILRKLYVVKTHLRHFRHTLEELKNKKTNPELAEALEDCLRNNEQNKLLKEFVRKARLMIGKIDFKYNNGRLFYYLSNKGVI